MKSGANLTCPQAGVDVAEPVQHAIPYAVLNETFHMSHDELAEPIQELHSTTVAVELVSKKGRPLSQKCPRSNKRFIV
jgi:hypothetical protein